MTKSKGQRRSAKSNGSSRKATKSLASGADNVVLTGSDFLQNISVKPTLGSSADMVRLSMPVSPSAFPGTRLAQMSQLFEKYVFITFVLRYVPAVPTTIACQLLAYIDEDPTDDPKAVTDTDALLRQAMAHKGSKLWNFHKPQTISLPHRSTNALYFTGAGGQNARLYQQGAFHIIQATAPANFNGEAVSGDLISGSLFVDWEIHFAGPQINPEAANLAVFAKEGPTLQTIEFATGDYTQTSVAKFNFQVSGSGALFTGATMVTTANSPSASVTNIRKRGEAGARGNLMSLFQPSNVFTIDSSAFFIEAGDYEAQCTLTSGDEFAQDNRGLRLAYWLMPSDSVSSVTVL